MRPTPHRRERPVSQPQTYNRQYNFTEYQALNPTLPLPAAFVDLEFNNVKVTLDQTLSNLKLIQRDDGKLLNGIVGRDQLAPDVVLGVNPSTPWAKGINYVVNDTVFFGLQLYRCLIAHIAGVFATDLAAGKWLLIADFSALVTAGVASIGGATGVVTIPGGNITGNVLTVVRYDASQTLTSPQKVTALANIGAQAALSAGTGISIVGATVSNTGLISLGGATGAIVAGAGVAVSGQNLNNTGVLSISGVTGAVIANAGLAVSGQNLNNDGVLTIAGNKGAFTLGDGLTNATNIVKADPAYHRGYLSGLELSTAGSTGIFGIASGVAADSTGAQLMLLSSALTKSTGAWVVGNVAGALDTGAISPNTWYHVHLIKRPDTGVVDVLVSLSATSPTLPANYTVFRRIGSMKTNGSSWWAKFTQFGDDFLWDAAVLSEINTATLSNTPTSFTLTGVPTGVKVFAHLSGLFQNAAVGVEVLVNSPDPTGAGPGGGLTTCRTQVAGIANAWASDIRTNTSAQVVAYASAASSTLVAATKGWTDTRGR